MRLGEVSRGVGGEGVQLGRLSLLVLLVLLVCARLCCSFVLLHHCVLALRA